MSAITNQTVRAARLLSHIARHSFLHHLHDYNHPHFLSAHSLCPSPNRSLSAHILHTTCIASCPRVILPAPRPRLPSVLSLLRCDMVDNNAASRPYCYDVFHTEALAEAAPSFRPGIVCDDVLFVWWLDIRLIYNIYVHVDLVAGWQLLVYGVCIFQEGFCFNPPSPHLMMYISITFFRTFPPSPVHCDLVRRVIRVLVLLGMVYVHLLCMMGNLLDLGNRVIDWKQRGKGWRINDREGETGEEHFFSCDTKYCVKALVKGKYFQWSRCFQVAYALYAVWSKVFHVFC